MGGLNCSRVAASHHCRRPEGLTQTLTCLGCTARGWKLILLALHIYVACFLSAWLDAPLNTRWSGETIRVH